MTVAHSDLTDETTVSYEWRIVPSEMGKLLMAHGLKRFDWPHSEEVKFCKYDHGWNACNEHGIGSGMLGPR